MIIRMTTRSGRQRSYDHRLRDLVQRTGDLTIATDLGVPRSTARGWLGATPRVVVTLETADLTEPELRQEILKLRRRVEKLAALLRLALALLRASGFRLSTARLPEGEAELSGRTWCTFPRKLSVETAGFDGVPICRTKCRTWPRLPYPYASSSKTSSA
jgi:hypothetical protein